MAETVVTEPPYVARLTEAFHREFPGCEVQHQHVRSDHYRFAIIWDKFDAMDRIERQDRVWAIADQLLDREELFKVPMIMTMGLEDLPPDDEE